MFGLGMGEIVIIAIVALLFLGPDKLPTAAKTIGKTIRGLRAQTRDLTESLEKDNELGDAVRELRSALHDDPRRQRNYGPPEAATADGDAEAGEHGDGQHVVSDGADLEDQAEHVDLGAAHYAAITGEADVDPDELDESVELAEPIGGEPDVPTVRPAAGSVARLYSEAGDDAPTEPPSQPKPVGEGNA